MLASLIGVQMYPAAGGDQKPLKMTTATAHGLFPEFSAKVRDYAMYACAGRTVTLKFNRSVKVNGVIRDTLRVRAEEHVVTQVTITENGLTYEYTIRCLPDKFPRLTTRTYATDLNGYLLVAPHADQTVNYLVMLDTRGVPIWYRENIEGFAPRTFTLLPNGEVEMLLHYIGAPDGPPTESRNRVIRFGLDGHKTREVKPSMDGRPIPTDHHGYARYGDTYYFMSNWEHTTERMPAALTSSSFRKIRVTASQEECRKAKRWKVLGARLIRTDRTGEVNWGYDIAENYDVDMPPQVLALRTEGGVPTCYLDAHHPNWVSVDPSGKILYVSLRYSNIKAIDIASKQILWTLGGVSEEGLKINGDPLKGISAGQHSVSVTPAGELLTFDNRNDPSETGRAVLYQLDLPSRSATFIRSFVPPKDRCTLSAGTMQCQTFVMGNASFTFDRNIMVDWGDKNGNPNLVTLFDRSGKVLLDLRDETRKTTTYKSAYIPMTVKGRDLVPREMLLRGTTARTVRYLVKE